MHMSKFMYTYMQPSSILRCCGLCTCSVQGIHANMHMHMHMHMYTSAHVLVYVYAHVYVKEHMYVALHHFP